jgi:RNA polymerase sigma-70 factor, ECF subfamily
MTSEQSLKSLIESCQRNPKGHFKAVYDTLIDQVFAYIKGRTSNNDDALDLTQEIFIDLYNAIPSFSYRSDGEFYSFIYTICKRKLAKHYGRQKAEIYPGDEILENLPNQEEPPAEDKDIQMALAKLEPETREIIILHHWSRYTFKDIALMLNLTESATRVRHHRALDTLATLLTKT